MYELGRQRDTRFPVRFLKEVVMMVLELLSNYSRTQLDGRGARGNFQPTIEGKPGWGGA